MKVGDKVTTDRDRNQDRDQDRNRVGILTWIGERGLIVRVQFPGEKYPVAQWAREIKMVESVKGER